MWRTFAVSLAVLAPMTVHGQQLKTTLAKLDAASAKFQNAQAKFQKDSYNALGQDHDLQTGMVYFQRVGAGTQAGIRAEGRDGKIVEYKNGIVRVFNLKQGCFDKYDSSTNKDRIESFLTLGFGTSGKELSQAWDIQDLGPENVGGVNAEKLELVGKSDAVRKTYRKVTLWMDLDRGVSVKQFFEAAAVKDTDTATYSDIQLNAKKVDTKPFQIKGNSCH